MIQLFNHSDHYPVNRKKEAVVDGQSYLSVRGWTPPKTRNLRFTCIPLRYDTVMNIIWSIWSGCYASSNMCVRCMVFNHVYAIHYCSSHMADGLVTTWPILIKFELRWYTGELCIHGIALLPHMLLKPKKLFVFSPSTSFLPKAKNKRDG